MAGPNRTFKSNYHSVQSECSKKAVADRDRQGQSCFSPMAASRAGRQDLVAALAGRAQEPLARESAQV